MRTVVDTGPLVAAAYRRERSHSLAASMLSELGRDAFVPDPVLVEADQLLRTRFGAAPARSLLGSAVAGEISISHMTPTVLRLAIEFDARYADLDLGLVDASVMAIADRERLPIFTFDFRDFRATRRSDGSAWPLIVDEAMYRRLVGP